jgi:hypothetical protein
VFALAVAILRRVTQFTRKIFHAREILISSGFVGSPAHARKKIFVDAAIMRASYDAARVALAARALSTAAYTVR